MEYKSKQIFDRPIKEVVVERTSVRTYEPKTLDENIKKNLMEYLDGVKTPFQSKVRYKLIEIKNSENKDLKLGTYGVIKGATSFIASAIENEDKSLFDLGYGLEKIILYAASLGIGTCWLGGTFKKGEFSKIMEIKEDEILPIITPIGYPSKKEGFIGALIRTIAKSKSRKPWEVFFDKDFKKPLTLEEAEEYAESLEMVRLAPSASNKQPWIIIKENNKLHLYLNHTVGYSKSLGYDIQKVDMGIAMCHLELSLIELGKETNWEQSEPNIKKSNENIEYIATIVATNKL